MSSATRTGLACASCLATTFLRLPAPIELEEAAEEVCCYMLVEPRQLRERAKPWRARRARGWGQLSEGMNADEDR
eukprot:1925406-Pyramimonas_sp.AAC.1